MHLVRGGAPCGWAHLLTRFSYLFVGGNARKIDAFETGDDRILLLSRVCAGVR